MMTINELRAEAEKLGYRLQKIPDYDCSCYIEYPNPNHMRKNGTWICIDRYENICFRKRRNRNGWIYILGYVRVQRITIQESP